MSLFEGSRAGEAQEDALQGDLADGVVIQHVLPLGLLQSVKYYAQEGGCCGQWAQGRGEETAEGGKGEGL